MKIDLNSYEVNKKHIIYWYDNQGYKKPEDAVSTIATAYRVPCIVCAYWIGEHIGWPEYIVNNIKVLIKFYDYQEILNKPENSPI